MKDEFFKFPSTPHLAALENIAIRGDKVLSEAERVAFLCHQLVVEEKVDGANLGISFDAEGNIRAQARGAYLDLPSHGQWKKLEEWLSARTDLMFDCLTDRYILFGEWCFARHTIPYEQLPDWFLSFDIFDRRAYRFLSTGRRGVFCKAMNVAQVPEISRGQFTSQEITGLLSKSRIANQPAEGLYLRIEDDSWLIQRAKLVRPAFIQNIEQHWTRGGIQPNHLKQTVY